MDHLHEHWRTGWPTRWRVTRRCDRRCTTSRSSSRASAMLVLLALGDEDTPCLETNLMLKRTIPGAALWIHPSTGHAINLQEPAALTRWSSRSSPTSSGGNGSADRLARARRAAPPWRPATPAAAVPGWPACGDLAVGRVQGGLPHGRRRLGEAGRRSGASAWLRLVSPARAAATETLTCSRMAAYDEQAVERLHDPAKTHHTHVAHDPTHEPAGRTTSVPGARRPERRRALLDSLDGRNGQTLRELCAGLAMAGSPSASTSPCLRWRI